MAIKRSGLGRGLDALIRDPKASTQKSVDKTAKTTDKTAESDDSVNKTTEKTAKADKATDKSAGKKVKSGSKSEEKAVKTEKSGTKADIKTEKSASKADTKTGKSADKTESKEKSSKKSTGKTEAKAKAKKEAVAETTAASIVAEASALAGSLAKQVKAASEAAGKSVTTGKSAATKKSAEAEKSAVIESTAVAEKSAVVESPAVVEKPATDEKKVVEESASTGNEELSVRISLVEPNKEQPRRSFSEESVAELADSIRQHGIIQPLLVRKVDDHYQIIAGERRWRAAKEAGLKEVPILVREYDEQKTAEVALIENLQREDLNPIEEAAAYRKLMEDYDLNQEEVAAKVSKSRAAVANAMRLLKLDDRVKELVIAGKLAEGHARALLAVTDGDMQLKLAEEIIENHLSVRQVEQLIKNLGKEPQVRTPKASDPQREAILAHLAEDLKSRLGTKVAINQKTKKKGVIEIEYYSDDDLERLYDLLQGIR